MFKNLEFQTGCHQQKQSQCLSLEAVYIITNTETKLEMKLHEVEKNVCGTNKNMTLIISNILVIHT